MIDENADICGTPSLIFNPSLSHSLSLSLSLYSPIPKKKKGQTFSLAEFTGAKTDYQDPIVLPTGPRQCTAKELDRDRNRLGGGIRNYGGDRANRSSSGGDDSSNSRWVTNKSSVPSDSRRFGSNGGWCTKLLLSYNFAHMTSKCTGSSK
ncbi:uncharacterized protein DS421_11g329740 [Arachis hypogaea]|nr:uncharacterized protein DS421_11g329740 [Arachis hypogaea]